MRPVLFAALLGVATATGRPFSAAAADREPPSNASCLDCHSEREVVGPRYLVDPGDLAVGPHAAAAVQCVDCHTKAATVADLTEHGRLGRASCDGCHEAAAELAAGEHSSTGVVAGRRSPSCSTCHGLHRILAVGDPASPVAPARQAATCGQCHRAAVIGSFLASVHGRAAGDSTPAKDASGSPRPRCSSCHGPHRIEHGDVLRSPRFKLAMVTACSGCHPKVAAEYRGSVHGVALLQRNAIESASCVDCHRGHEIYRPGDPRAAVFATRVTDDCAKCHADATLIRRFNLPGNVVESFQLSYHGLAGREGDVRVANCATCHEFHAVYRATDPRSSIHPRNLAKTCGKCHLGATDRFIQGTIHVSAGSQQHRAVAVVRALYVWLIAMILGGMALHNVLDFLRKMRLRRARQAAEPTIERLTRLERRQHAVLIASFFLLGYTGFALRYPGAWWVAPLRWAGTTEVFRSLLHRVAGVGPILAGLFHLGFLRWHRRGREQWTQLVPRLRDVHELIDNVRYYLGRRPHPPRFGRFGYIEKAEYWALVWGTAVMAITGLVMWFQVQALRWLPRWVFDVCATVHFYEAILAVSAIVVWHFYFVMVNPEDAPLSTVFLDGRVTLEHLREHRPAEYDELVRRGALPSEGAGEGASEGPAEGSGGPGEGRAARESGGPEA
ncbi:MAG: cytochrome c3 family protein [Proteobacteria bacterium]|nr:cytochrome c3 family protein [Pseudomonadota bacterium]